MRIVNTLNPAAEAAAIRVEQTMRQLKVWGVPPPVLKPYRQPFAMDAMPFENWIQLVLVPRLREVARGEQPMPPSSNLAGHAVREFDGWDAMQPLIDALREVDALSKPPQAPTSAGAMSASHLPASLAHLGPVLGVIFAIYVGKWAVDHLGQMRGWPAVAVGAVAALVVSAPFLFWSLRIAQRRRGARRA